MNLKTIVHLTLLDLDSIIIIILCISFFLTNV